MGILSPSSQIFCKSKIVLKIKYISIKEKMANLSLHYQLCINQLKRTHLKSEKHYISKNLNAAFPFGQKMIPLFLITPVELCKKIRNDNQFFISHFVPIKFNKALRVY